MVTDSVRWIGPGDQGCPVSLSLITSCLLSVCRLVKCSGDRCLLPQSRGNLDLPVKTIETSRRVRCVSRAT